MIKNLKPRNFRIIFGPLFWFWLTSIFIVALGSLRDSHLPLSPLYILLAPFYFIFLPESLISWVCVLILSFALYTFCAVVIAGIIEYYLPPDLAKNYSYFVGSMFIAYSLFLTYCAASFRSAEDVLDAPSLLKMLFLPAEAILSKSLRSKLFVFDLSIISAIAIYSTVGLGLFLLSFTVTRRKGVQ